MLRKVPHYLRPTPPPPCSAGKLLANARVWFDETSAQIIHSNILGAKRFQPSLYSQVQRLFRQLFILMLIWTKAAQDTTSHGNWDSKKLKIYRENIRVARLRVKFVLIKTKENLSIKTWIGKTNFERVETLFF